MGKFIISAFGDEIDKSLDIQMEVLASHNIKHIELRGVDWKNVADLTLEEAKSIKKRLDDKGFSISAIGSPIGKISITDDFEPHLDLFDKLLAMADVLNTKYIRIFSFFMPEGENPEKYRDEVMRRLQELTRRAENENIILLHENEKDIYGDIPERCLDIFKTIDSPNLKATFDPANFVQCKVKPYPEAFNMLKDYVVYMHMKDALMDGGDVVPAGYGDGCIIDLLSVLKKMNYEGFVSLEPHLASFVGLEHLEKNVDLSKKETDGIRLFGIAVKALNNILSQLD